MKSKKQRLFNIIEKFLNEHKKDDLELFYGLGTKIKIHSISHSLKSKSVLLECVIILGDTINEEILDRSLADYLIKDACDYVLPDLNIKTMIRWDC